MILSYWYIKKDRKTHIIIKKQKKRLFDVVLIKSLSLKSKFTHPKSFP